ncbi:DUF6562 domain-containing protein, partial [Bacteroides sp.]
LTASLPADFAQPQPQSRALPAAPTAHKLRCILEVWTQDPSPALKYREEKVGLSGDNVVFDFTIDEGTYDCLFWADFIGKDAKDLPTTIGDLSSTHYDDKIYTTNDATNGLKAISIINNAYVFNTDARDAFFGHYVLDKQAAAVTNPSIDALTRPFAKLTIKEKDPINYSYCSGLTAKYEVPTTFNVLDGTVSGTAQVTCSSKSTEPQTLFSDYILTDASSTLGSIDLTFTGTKDLQSVTIPAGIPLKRNYKTNAAGSLISEKPVPIKDVKLTVDINSDWTTPGVDYDTDVAPARNILDAAKTEGTGDDAKNYHYTIDTPEELAALSTLAKADAVITGCTTAKYRYANYKLSQNIDLKNEPWTPIDDFFGTFDGQGYTISKMNVSITSQSTSAINGGLFGYISTDGTVSNLIVEGAVTVKNAGSCRAGGICGWLSGTIEFCRFNGTVSSTATGSESKNYAGGIMGSSNGVPAITGCIANAKATVSGGKADYYGAGGLAGYMLGTNCEYSAWNNNSEGTSDMIGKNDNNSSSTACSPFTTISGLNALLSDINAGVSSSTYIWQAGSGSTDYPILVKRTPAGN